MAPGFARPPGRIQLGIDVLAGQDFSPLAEKRVGLLTHAAGLDRHGRRTIDVLHRARRVRLEKLFGPEHGIEGAFEAGAKVVDGRDRATGLPVFSLYGRTRKPTPEMLGGLDSMVVDLQDIGSRSYTYVSAMKLTMEACFEAGIEVVVLDRPNPLGGQKVDGPVIEEPFRSYVGPFPTPYVHGLTIGEIARMAESIPGWLEVSEEAFRRGRLQVIPMQGWSRGMLWTGTGLPWVATSPHIPDVSAVLGYPITGLGAQIGGFRHGIGTPFPFRLLYHPEQPLERVRESLASFRVRGLQYQGVETRSEKGAPVSGYYLRVDDWPGLRPTEISFHLMRQACRWAERNPFATAPESEQGLFNKLVGSHRWWEEITSRGPRARVESFIAAWEADARRFQEQSRRYWLYA